MLDNKSAGIILKEARLSKNISLEAASKYTKIHLNVLKSMEADDFKSLGGVYAKSFLKLYGEYLGLDKDDLLRRFNNSSGTGDMGAPRRVRIPGDEQSLSVSQVFINSWKWLSGYLSILKKLNLKLVVISILILFAIVGISKIIKHRKQSQHMPQKTEARKTPQKKNLLEAKAVTQKSGSSSQTLASTESMEALVSKELAAAGREQEKIVLVIRAKEKSWLQVKVDGKVVFQHVFAKDTAESWKASEKIELWMGNAGAFQLELNGKLLGKIGRPGQTLKHVVVTRAGLSIQK